jgi:hypothetical protein
LRAEHQEAIDRERRESQERAAGADPTRDQKNLDALFDDASRDGSEGPRDRD